MGYVFRTSDYRRSSLPPRRESPPRERLGAELRDERELAPLLREGADERADRLGVDERERLGLEDFELRLGADCTRGVERDGAESRPLERLRLGADCLLGAYAREVVAPRDDEEAEVRLLRDGAEERSRALLERAVRPRGTSTDERERSDRLLRAPLMSDAEREDERSTPRDRPEADSRELEAPLRNDSLTRPARLPEERADAESEERARELARSGALPVTLRLRSRCSPTLARCVRCAGVRLLPRSRLSTRER